MYRSTDRLIIFDADGTVVDAFAAMVTAFALHGLDIGDLERFQKRRNLFKYLGGIKEFPRNLAKQLGKRARNELLDTLTQVYRENTRMYPEMARLLQDMVETPGIRIGLVTRNVCREPETTFAELFARHDIDMDRLDFVHHLPLLADKQTFFRAERERFDINPARAYVCGDEHRDYLAAIAAGMHPFIASYGFESHARLTKKFAIPAEIVAPDSLDLAHRIRHALDL